MLPVYSDLNVFRKDLLKLKTLHDANSNLLRKLKESLESGDNRKYHENRQMNDLIIEMIQDKPRFSDYLTALTNYYEDYISIYLKRKEFINKLFEQSDDEEISVIAIRNKKIKKIKNN